MKRRHGFTLIELLVVIAIIGLLVSMLMPSLSGARAQAKTSVCLSNLKRLGVGVVLYASQHRDQLPPFRLRTARPTLQNHDYVNNWGRKFPRWQWFIDEQEVGPVIDPEPFLDEIESSGSFGDSSIGRNGELGTTMTNKYFICPSLTDEFAEDVRNGAYGYNYQYLGNSRHENSPTEWDNFPVGMSRIRSGGQTVLIGDSRGGGRIHGKHSYTLDPPRLAVERRATKFGPGANDVEIGVENPELFRYSPVEARHGKNGNVVFIDGHAESSTLQELGYELTPEGFPRPILDPLGDTYEASNKAWNGEAYDHIAVKHRPD
jgi:prepilin-type N-terminal cleavage/methylation domain-containing protein/prepilin-type processing-associated H-X9-DG protein